MQQLKVFLFRCCFRSVTRGLIQGKQSVGAVDWGPHVKGSGGRSHPSDNSDLMAQNNSFFNRFETFYIPVTIVNSDHVVEASMLWKIKHNTTD